ncbi:autotransporter outer membrane beta-barrel domain-containing protein [Avibacterium avium]|uniref:autotransporter outer membrane beta-barrel domain-containing protein n=1 Tax=Avibacterium avium TaxID=751 RepID=UPI003BF8AB1D
MMKNLKLLPLAIAVGAGLYGIPMVSMAACSVSDNTVSLDNSKCYIGDGTISVDSDNTVTVNSETPIAQQGKIVIKTDLSGSENALILGDSLGLRFTVDVGGEKTETFPVTIQSDGTAILYNGTSLRAASDGIKIYEGSLVKGGEYAINAPNLTTNNMKITLDGGTIEGNIAINDFTGSSHQMEVSKNSTINGDIEGVNNFNVVNGSLSVKSGDSGLNWGKAYVQVKDGASLKLALENNNVDSILTTSKVSFADNSEVALVLENGITADDIEGKDITLLTVTGESQTSTTNLLNVPNKVAENVKIFQGDEDITDQLKNSRDLPKAQDEWLALTKQAGTLKSWIDNNNLLFKYTSSSDIKVKDESIPSFLANAEERPDFVKYILDNSFGAGNEDREAILRNNPKNAQAAKLSRQFLPDLTASDITAAWVWGEQMRSHIEQRTLAYRHQLPSYEREDGWNLWATTSLGRGKDSGEYKLNRYGVHFGMDRQINDEALIGFSAGVNRSSLASERSDIDKKVTQFIFMPYVEWKGDLYFAGANLLGGTYSVDSTRQIGNTTATGDYSGFQFGYQLTGGIDTEVKGVGLRPFLSLKQQWFNNEGWEETGSPFALSADTQKYSAQHIGGGISLWKRFDLAIGKFVPSLDLQYYKQMGGSDATMSYRLASDSATTGYDFNVNNITGNQFSTKLNARLDITENLNISGSLSYNKFGNYKETVVGFGLSNTF